MSTPRRPPQRPDAKTFRRRRIVVLIILVLLAGGITYGVLAVKNWLFPAEPEVVEEQEAEPDGPTAEELANPKDCRPDALELDVRLSADSLPAGETANIPMTIKNTGEVPCLFDASSSTLSVRITSGDDPVWSSAHCGGGLPEERILLLDSGALDTSVVVWPGTRSEKGCPSDQPATSPGTYRLHAVVMLEGGTLESEQVFGQH